MIFGLNRLHMGAMDAFMVPNCRKSRPGPNGTRPGTQNQQKNKKTKKNIKKMDNNL